SHITCSCGIRPGAKRGSNCLWYRSERAYRRCCRPLRRRLPGRLDKECRFDILPAPRRSDTGAFGKHYIIRVSKRKFQPAFYTTTVNELYIPGYHAANCNGYIIVVLVLAAGGPGCSRSACQPDIRRPVLPDVEFISNC